MTARTRAQHDRERLVAKLRDVTRGHGACVGGTARYRALAKNTVCLAESRAHCGPRLGVDNHLEDHIQVDRLDTAEPVDGAEHHCLGASHGDWLQVTHVSGEVCNHGARGCIANGFGLVRNHSPFSPSPLESRSSHTQVVTGLMTLLLPLSSNRGTGRAGSSTGRSEMAPRGGAWANSVRPSGLGTASTTLTDIPPRPQSGLGRAWASEVLLLAVTALGRPHGRRQPAHTHADPLKRYSASRPPSRSHRRRGSA